MSIQGFKVTEHKVSYAETITPTTEKVFFF